MISVIIPAYNEEGYIEKTLKSLQRQTFKEFETIVICDSCTDETEEIAKKYGCKTARIKARNVSKARNMGAELAKNQTFVFLDSDTTMSEDTLEKISKLEGVGVCKAKPDNGKLKARLYMKLKNLQLRYWGCTGLIFCDKEVFKKVGGFDENLKKGETGKFIRAAKEVAEHHIAKTYVSTSTRRYEKWGYLKTVRFWIREYRKPSKEEYEAVR